MERHSLHEKASMTNRTSRGRTGDVRIRGFRKLDRRTPVPLNLSIARAGKIEGVEQIVLAVATTQESAIALYQSLGFRSFGMERRALKIGERYVDFQHMVLEVSAGTEHIGPSGLGHVPSRR
jgi:hypothetical protein